MCVNLHMIASKAISLGMKRINGSMKAEGSVIIIAERRSEFGFNLKEHIAGMVTDGAAFMKKTGQLSKVPILHQICHSHGIHLAVVGVLYKKIMLVKMKSSHLIVRLSMKLQIMKNEILMTILK